MIAMIARAEEHTWHHFHEKLRFLNLRQGTHLKAYTTLGEHHALYCSPTEVVHYVQPARAEDADNFKCTLDSWTFERFCKEFPNLHVAWYPDTDERGAAIAGTARERLGEASYCFFRNRGELFVCQCICASGAYGRTAYGRMMHFRQRRELRRSNAVKATVKLQPVLDRTVPPAAQGAPIRAATASVAATAASTATAATVTTDLAATAGAAASALAQGAAFLAGALSVAVSDAVTNPAASMVATGPLLTAAASVSPTCCLVAVATAVGVWLHDRSCVASLCPIVLVNKRDSAISVEVNAECLAHSEDSRTTRASHLGFPMALDMPPNMIQEFDPPSAEHFILNVSTESEHAKGTARSVEVERGAVILIEGHSSTLVLHEVVSGEGPCFLRPMQ
ncbi:unnamed protein product [Symbiodinium natans]|uniref:Uncharacterized protein n=1 Tax=Symbiodinium natans TaxID=878477 RepID=A0A812H0G7_9DINO|nr:unnamed protein product [Symbiodinium natans]